MRVMWFEVSCPSRYKDKGRVIGGWQDSLETIARQSQSLELIIAFEGRNGEKETKIVDSVTYIPIPIHYSLYERKWKNRYSWEPRVKQLLKRMKVIISQYHPDLIHIFGTEWPFGLIAEVTDVPVVIHIQGAIIPYYNANFPPGYSIHDIYKQIHWYTPWKYLAAIFEQKKRKEHIELEKRIWKSVRFYMGRTDWDKALSAVLHPGRMYFHVDEALRPQFISNDGLSWNCPQDSVIHLISTGCSTFWKGPDMMLKTAKVLKSLGVKFEWVVAGSMPRRLKQMVEKHEKTTFYENNIRFLGFVQPKELMTFICHSTIYVHTAYVENSPNSICEAQCLGCPVISTNVGGISTLIQHNEDGVLVPANDPWQMANAIIEMTSEKDKMFLFSKRAKEKALARHNPLQIEKQLLSCYFNLILGD